MMNQNSVLTMAASGSADLIKKKIMTYGIFAGLIIGLIVVIGIAIKKAGTSLKGKFESMFSFDNISKNVDKVVDNTLNTVNTAGNKTINVVEDVSKNGIQASGRVATTAMNTAMTTGIAMSDSAAKNVPKMANNVGKMIVSTPIEVWKGAIDGVSSSLNLPKLSKKRKNRKTKGSKTNKTMDIAGILQAQMLKSQQLAHSMRNK